MIKPGLSIRGKITSPVNLQGKTNASIIKEYPALEDIEIIPTIDDQKVKSDFYGINEVTVKGVTADIDEDIKPENIKAGINILGVEGGYEGIDTSDATATSDDIASGKTAYVNNQKIEGTVETISNNTAASASNVYNLGLTVGFQTKFTKPYLFRQNSRLLVSTNNENVVEAIKLTPEQIVEGNTVLGVKGSTKILDTSDATAKSSDILQGETAYVNSEKIEGTMQKYDGSYEGNVSIGNEWEEIFKSSIDNTYGSKVTKLPRGITTIGKYAFEYCTNLKITELPDTITSIGDNAFSNCTNLALTKLPSKLTSIGKNCFNRCNKLDIKEIPVGITIIPQYAFGYCNGIKTLNILGNITEFAGQCFYNCNYLEKVVLPNITSVPKLGSNVFDSTKISYGQGYIYVPDNLIEQIKSATNWSAYAERIKPISELEV